MSTRCFVLAVAATLALLIVSLLLEQFTNLDAYLAGLCYDRFNGWAIPRSFHQAWGSWLDTLPKILLGALGGLCALALSLSFFRPRLVRLRRPLLKLLLALALVPALIAGAKAFTNVHCPRELIPYGGDLPYVRLLESLPDAYPKVESGRCFPAGHATGGFALMMLYFCFTSPWARRAGLAAGLLAGSAMAAYQMLRGEHFLSHSLVTALASWLLILLINQGVDRAAKRCGKRGKALECSGRSALKGRASSLQTGFRKGRLRHPLTRLTHHLALRGKNSSQCAASW